MLRSALRSRCRRLHCQRKRTAIAACHSADNLAPALAQPLDHPSLVSFMERITPVAAYSTRRHPAPPNYPCEFRQKRSCPRRHRWLPPHWPGCCGVRCRDRRVVGRAAKHRWTSPPAARGLSTSSAQTFGETSRRPSPETPAPAHRNDPPSNCPFQPASWIEPRSAKPRNRQTRRPAPRAGHRKGTCCRHSTSPAVRRGRQ